MQKVEYIDIEKLQPHPRNPRLIKNRQFKILCKSIKNNPDYFETRPILCNTDMIIFAGNQRLQAAKAVGLKQVPTVVMDISQERQDELMIRDNRSNGEWDNDFLATYNLDFLKDCGFEDVELGFATEQGAEDNLYKDKAIGSLEKRFVCPPFSVLDTKQGYWQERKNSWRDMIKDYGESRENTLSKGNSMLSNINSGVSLLDPVLSEVINTWFTPKEHCKVFDCFAGDSVFGYVSSCLGNIFTGIELRLEQADLNNQRTAGMTAKYICDDGQNVLDHIEKDSQDLLFSCPPYFDLEVYSDLENDASNQGDYCDFLKIIDTAFTNAAKCLKENRFAVIVVGDIRDNTGAYRNFPDDIKRIFLKNGFILYNELILLEMLGTAPVRAANMMKTRKVVKTHQNVLVFYKGDQRKIKDTFQEIKGIEEACNEG